MGCHVRKFRLVDETRIEKFFDIGLYLVVRSGVGSEFSSWYRW